MKKCNLIVILLLVVSTVFAQSKTVYNAFKPGLSIRESPSAQAAVISKISYGEKLTLVNPYSDTVSVINEGMTGYWNLVEYKGKKGYVVGIYLFDMPPPKASVKTMKDYFAQLSAVASPLVVYSKNKNTDEMFSQYKKQLYKNGCEYHEATFYESGYNTYFLPEVDLQKGFILTRLIPEFKDAFSATDVYPTENKKIKVKRQAYESDKEIKVVKSTWGNAVDKIVVTYEDGANYEFEIYELNGQLVISFGGGV
ncbi:MAG: SH3 domain-containing protein [Ferruginibacter sp.]|nr:SH3 domain-containing protein [Ferruginibacter sp.]